MYIAFLYGLICVRVLWYAGSVFNKIAFSFVSLMCKIDGLRNSVIGFCFGALKLGILRYYGKRSYFLHQT